MGIDVQQIDWNEQIKEDISISGSLTLEGRLHLKERTTDPNSPPEGQSVIWMSDGTAAGDDGDIMIKITAGGITKTITLIDFSAS